MFHVLFSVIIVRMTKTLHIFAKTKNILTQDYTNDKNFDFRDDAADEYWHTGTDNGEL